MMKPNTCFNALIKETDDGWFLGQVEEVPEAMSQGKTIEELMENLEDALCLILELRREETLKHYIGEKFFTRQIVIE
jgi:predicted RNase H-like HicB family nuclease